MDKTNKHNFKLEDIKKDNVFHVPEGYFEDLPMHIQKRVEEKPSWFSVYSSRLVFGLKYALPVILVLILSVVYFSQNTEKAAPEELIAEVNTADILYYLKNNIDVSSYEILDEIAAGDLAVDFSEDPLQELNDLNIDESLYDNIIIEDEFFIN